MQTIMDLSNERLRTKAPSIFGENPWHERSEKYKFVPTIKVIDALRDVGYFPVDAQQSTCRIKGKEPFAKHLVRFRSSDDLEADGIVPEVVLMNSHDGTSAYSMNLGLFRFVCCNGLLVGDTLQSIKVRHVGNFDICEAVIDGAKNLVNEAPKVFKSVNRWKTIDLDPREQLAYAQSAAEAYGSTMELRPETLLRARRREDTGNGTRDLWKTFNVVQENMVKGGQLAKDTQGHLRRMRQLKSVDRGVKLNRALWVLAEEMAKIKKG